MKPRGFYQTEEQAAELWEDSLPCLLFLKQEEQRAGCESVWLQKLLILGLNWIKCQNRNNHCHIKKPLKPQNFSVSEIMGSLYYAEKIFRVCIKDFSSPLSFQLVDWAEIYVPKG